MIRIKLKKSLAFKTKKRLKNKARLRKKISGTNTVPRLNVFRSGKHVYAQIIDDIKGLNLSSFSSLSLKKHKGSLANKASQVGMEIGKKALSKKIKKVVFDRGGFIYHGRIKALAEGARKAGLKF